ncbi:hypothetical protein EV278_10276 [Caulobacter sp. BK020]|nr:hypothetical protein EV278_10276 [Caulobacter sp. BK020]
MGLDDLRISTKAPSLAVAVRRAPQGAAAHRAG